ncbi:MAG: hypothetical protein AAF610_01100 [Pseudomonadota bacterium]
MTQNPYATPQADELLLRSDMTPEDASLIRRQFRGVERLLRSIGLVYFVQALFVTLVSFWLLTLPNADAVRTISGAVYCLMLAVVLMIAGYGLRTLALWSRLAALVQTLYLFGGFAFGLLAYTINGRAAFVFAVLHALPFYVLFSSRAVFVLSRRYADVIALTPGQRPAAWRHALIITAFLAMMVLLDGVMRAPLWLQTDLP